MSSNLSPPASSGGIPPLREEFMLSILESIADPIFVKDERHRWIHLNNAFCAFMGRTREELLGKSDYDFFPKEQADVFWEKDALVFESGKENINEEKFTDAKDVMHTIVTKKNIFTNTKGQKILVGIIRDITELQRTHEKLEQEVANARKFLQAVEASGIATVITTPEPKIIYANPAWEQLTGYSEEEAIGQNPRVLRSGKTPKEMYQRMWRQILQGEEFFTEDIVNRRKNGSEYNAELHVYPMKEDDRVQYFVGLQTDITLRKRTDKAKSEFVSLASHQLRTPLTGLRWGLSMLRKKGPLNAQQTDITDELQKASARMAESIDVMLHLSRIEAGKVEPKIVPVSIDVFVKELCDEYHPQAEIRHHQCASHVSEGVIIHTDAILLHEIVSNLISNAMKYTPDGGSITVSAKVIDQHLRMSVSDTGFGIPADQQQQVFSKFFRATNVVDKTPDGTGLGLYLAYSLTQLLGGTLLFVSSENEGSTFTLSLPLTPPIP